jgi:hypothetical protein
VVGRKTERTRIRMKRGKSSFLQEKPRPRVKPPSNEAIENKRCCCERRNTSPCKKAEKTRISFVEVDGFDQVEQSVLCVRSLAG